MKILYGFNGVGNGHMARTRIMVPKLRAAGADVTCIMSGRAADPSIDVGQEGDIIVREGLTLATKDGKMQYMKTGFGIAAALPGMIKDAMNLDLSEYDLVISDFEPVSAWAAKMQGVPSIGLAHHFAFRHDVPKTKSFSAFMTFMDNIVKADTELGMHFHHFGQPILPPLFTAPEPQETDPKKILVFLNFENLQDVQTLLAPFEDYEFYIYSKQASAAEDKGNLHIRPLSKDGFKQDMADCAGLITNAGFVAPAEALQMGKKILVKPQTGQVEQECNALALEKLNYGSVMKTLDPAAVSTWLARDDFNKVSYPDTAQAVTDWIMAGDYKDPQPMIDALWAQAQTKPAPV